MAQYLESYLQLYLVSWHILDSPQLCGSAVLFSYKSIWLGLCRQSIRYNGCTKPDKVKNPAVGTTVMYSFYYNHGNCYYQVYSVSRYGYI